MCLFHSIIPTWWAENGLSGGQYYGTAALADQVWVCNRCLQLNSQQIASCRSSATGRRGRSRPGSRPRTRTCSRTGSGTRCSRSSRQLYGWGFALPVRHRLLRRRLPAALDGARLVGAADPVRGRRARVQARRGASSTRERVVQIDRNPTTAAHGTSAIRPTRRSPGGCSRPGTSR